MRHRKDKCVCISLDTWCGMICGKSVFCARCGSSILRERAQQYRGSYSSFDHVHTLSLCVLQTSREGPSLLLEASGNSSLTPCTDPLGHIMRLLIIFIICGTNLLKGNLEVE